VSSPSTATLSPLRTVKTPSGRPASAHSRASHSAAEGTFSLGLSTTVLPAAMASGKNHIGTIAGKLNGLITATGPSGWRIEVTSTCDEAFSVKAPFSRWRSRRRTRRPPARGDLTARVGQDLAVLGGDQRGELVSPGVQQLTEAEEQLGAAGQRRVPPARERRDGGRDGGRDVRWRGERHAARQLSGGGVGHVGVAVPGSLVVLAGDPVGQRPRRLRGSLRACGGGRSRSSQASNRRHAPSVVQAAAYGDCRFVSFSSSCLTEWSVPTSARAIVVAVTDG
jgi:hypothetical protein